MIIHEIKSLDGVNEEEEGPSYFTITHEGGKIILPVVNAVATVPLPSKLRFEHVRSGKKVARSRFFEW